MASWGDINAVLNRLVREGTIAGFWTNLGEAPTPFGLHVIVAPVGPVDQAGAEDLRARVAQRLEPLAADVTVTVDRSGRVLDRRSGP